MNYAIGTVHYHFMKFGFDILTSLRGEFACVRGILFSDALWFVALVVLCCFLFFGKQETVSPPKYSGLLVESPSGEMVVESVRK